MALDNETYDLIDEYLVSAVEIVEQMYKEHGETVFVLLKDCDHFDEFRDRTYELTEEIPDEMLELFKDKYMNELIEKLSGKATPIAIAKKDLLGKLEYDLRVQDTSIKLHKTGRNIEWGSNTPIDIKSIIQNIVMKG